VPEVNSKRRWRREQTFVFLFDLTEFKLKLGTVPRVSECLAAPCNLADHLVNKFRRQTRANNLEAQSLLEQLVHLKQGH